MITKLYIVPRYCPKYNEVLLFYYDDKRQLVCFCQSEGHSVSDYGYYKNSTKPVPPEKQKEAEDHFKSYTEGEDFFIESYKLKQAS